MRLRFKGKSRVTDPTDNNNRLRLALTTHHSPDAVEKVWEDTAEQTLENTLTEIVVEILVTAERRYREGCLRHREWHIKRRAELEAAIQRERAEAERKAHELRAKQEKERLERLLSEAKTLDRSNIIRAYVSAVKSRASEIALPNADIELWAAWALVEADRIDPIKNGTAQAAIAAVVESFAAPK